MSISDQVIKGKGLTRQQEARWKYIMPDFFPSTGRDNCTEPSRKSQKHSSGGVLCIVRRLHDKKVHQEARALWGIDVSSFLSAVLLPAGKLSRIWGNLTMPTFTLVNMARSTHGIPPLALGASSRWLNLENNLIRRKGYP